ncbi:ferredoxin [Chlamydia crocodili]|uniref:Ferredoxin n=1 Tax=Chlamydia crocodili TaxID=2766982 RepID=A0ABX8CDX4_9CHLA|nr:ferredoxin [Chlamydia crocodili]QVE49208.1 ferredoxin [Chlamydia crocodili]
MNHNSLLVFSCPCCCEGEVSFSVFSLEEVLACSCCSSTYAFDPSMRNSIRQFAALCLRIHEASSILGHAAVSVSIQDSAVEIPFQLLFSRFPVVFNLTIEGKKIAIRFIFDALKREVLHKENVSLV